MIPIFMTQSGSPLAEVMVGRNGNETANESVIAVALARAPSSVKNRRVSRWNYTRGLHDLGNRCFAWLQPDGSLGWSNAGLVAGVGGSLLVDTLWDVPLTRSMLDGMSGVTAGAPIEMLVNTHANGDHWWGNELLAGTEIVASRRCRDEMTHDIKPSDLAALMQLSGLGAGADYFRERVKAFDFTTVTPTLPTRVFDGSLDLEVGGTEAVLIEVGPAHTLGDTLVHVPGAKTIFTGDILFIDGTPIMWQGPIENWIRACDLMLGMDLDVVVPGHGPITDLRGVRAVRNYLAYIHVEARKRFDAGLSPLDAAKDIALDDFSSWGDAERIAVNVDTLYREFSKSDSPPDVLDLLGRMAEVERSRRT
jgi:cyclase